MRYKYRTWDGKGGVATVGLELELEELLQLWASVHGRLGTLEELYGAGQWPELEALEASLWELVDANNETAVSG